MFLVNIPASTVPGLDWGYLKRAVQLPDVGLALGGEGVPSRDLHL